MERSVKTTADFLDDLRVKFTLPSDGRLAVHMGMKPQQLSLYRRKRETFSDETALKIAAQLGIEPFYIMACMGVQRARNPETRSAWERIAAKVAAAVLLAIAAGAPTPAGAILHNPISGTNGTRIHICVNSRTRRATRPATLVSALLRALALALALLAPAQAGDWSGYDTGREVAYQLLLAVDCGQTRYGARHPEQFAETNRLLPEHPSVGQVNNICLGTHIGHFLISRWIPAGPARTAWQGVSIMIEVYAVDSNRMAGVKVEF